MSVQIARCAPTADVNLWLRRFKQGNTLLLTPGALRSLPQLYSQDKVKDPLVKVKFFNPTGAMTWYATEAEIEYGPMPGVKFDEDVEYGPENGQITDVRFFGKVTGGFSDELGYFSLVELATAQRYSARSIGRSVFRVTIPIERDIHWTPTPLSRCK